MSYIKHKSDESIEDYLETIYELHKTKSDVRSIDIANALSFTKASVSVAMKNLQQKDLIQRDEQGYITLTPDGLAIAKRTYERHTLLREWLIYLGVPPEIASADACKMEHDISEESFEAIKNCINAMMQV